MTYKGAIDEVKMLSQNPMMPDIFKASLNKIAETLEMEKETEPCEDAISRQAVLDAIKAHYANTWIDGALDIRARVVSLPPVNPTSNVSIQITEREKYGRFN